MASQSATEMKSASSTHYKDWPNAAGFNASEDHREKITLAVTGKIPSYAAGVLYRTGPGGYKEDVSQNGRQSSTGHWFDGYTVMHRFEILPTSDGSTPKVTYCSYAQVDELIEKVRRSGRRDDLTFGSKRDPCDGLFRKVKTMFFPPTEPHSPHDANIGVVLRDPMPHELEQVEKANNNHAAGTADRNIMTVTTDAVSVKHFDSDTLEPLGVTDQRVLHPSLNGQLSAAHAAHDPDNGDIFNYNLHLGAFPTYKVFRASPSNGKVDILAKISGTRGSYLHSMLISENYLILCIWPAYYKALGLSILYNRNILDAIETFDPDSARTKWFVIDRRGGRGVVKTFESSPFFCFHTVNAWEEIGKNDTVDVVCELVQYKDMSILHKFYYENMVSDSPGVAEWNRKVGLSGAGLARYRLRGVPSSGTAGLSRDVEELFNIGDSAAGDLPRINPHFATKPHRYVWTAVARDKSSFLDGLAKTDTTTGTALIWEHDKHTPGEPIFVPRPSVTSSEVVAEDEGIVLAVILDGVRGTSYLLCLDAATMTELGRADVGYPVGFGFHGAFVPKTRL